MRRFLTILSLAICVSCFPGNHLAHSQTSMTYELNTTVPGPFGSYYEMKLVPHTSAATCDSNNAGMLYVDDNEYLYFCQNNQWRIVGVWSQVGNDVFLTDETNPSTKIGIGTKTPPLRLSVEDGGIFAVGTPATPSPPPDTLATNLPEEKFFWHPEKGAIRGGIISGGGYINNLLPNDYEWDDTYIGLYSAAFGQNSLAWHTGTTVSGGNNNAAACIYSTVGGGSNNIAGNAGRCATNINDSPGATVGGGQNNSVYGAYNVIAGGNSNIAWGPNSSILGGANNIAGNGPWNIPVGQYITVGGGRGNIALIDFSVIGGGENNFITWDHNFIGGGYDNRTEGQATHGVITGGRSNTINNNADSSTIGGGGSNTVSNDYSTISGGQLNTASGNRSTVSGGQGNRAIAAYSAVHGGQGSTASGSHSSVGGGQANAASGGWSWVSGGEGNAAQGNYSAVSGQTNTASGSHSSVGGGETNVASGTHSSVSGGQGSGASGSHSFVGGGESNIASGDFAAVSGGQFNSAGGDWSWAGGRNMQLANTATGTFAWGNAATGLAIGQPDSFIIAPGTNVGIGTIAPTTTLHIDHMVRLEPQPAPPACIEQGRIYVSSFGGGTTLCLCDGATWIDLRTNLIPGECR